MYDRGMTEIRTISEAITALGGTRRTAELLNVVDSAVSNWRRLGHIPRQHHLVLYLELLERGFVVDLSLLFGVELCERGERLAIAYAE